MKKYIVYYIEDSESKPFVIEANDPQDAERRFRASFEATSDSEHQIIDVILTKDEEITEEAGRLAEQIVKRYLNKDERQSKGYDALANLESVIEMVALLSNSPSEVLSGCKQIVEKSEYADYIADMLEFEQIEKAVYIRGNLQNALEEAEQGYDLADPLGWGLSDRDLTILAKLHKKNVCRSKIEDLLQSCNFHYENGLFQTGQYDQFI